MLDRDNNQIIPHGQIAQRDPSIAAHMPRHVYRLVPETLDFPS